MKRREWVLGAAALFATSGLRAQAPKVRRIGFLMLGTRETHKGMIDAFEKRLVALGWEKDRNALLDVRYADNRYERLPSLAKELVEGKPDLVVTSSTPAAIAMKQVTAAIPIVFTSVADPVALGLVQSLGRPGGNMTGVSSLIIDTAAKQVELLKTLMPKLERIAVLVAPNHPANKMLVSQLEAATKNARATLVVVEATTPQAVEAAFAKVTSERATALVIPPDPLYFSVRDRIAQLAITNRIATVFASATFVRDGGLVSYGVNYVTEFVRAAEYVDRILRGAKPADLPVEQVERFLTVINRSTAKALGITIPQSVLMRADEVIE